MVAQPRNPSSSAERPPRQGAHSQNIPRGPATNIENEPDVVDPFYGDIPGPAREGCFRIHSINTGPMPLDDHEDNQKASKYDDLFTAVRQYGTNILLLQEMCTNWSMVARQHQWWNRVEDQMDMSETKAVSSHNMNAKVQQRYQPGGTALMSHGKISHYAMGIGRDPRKLGRWIWARYRGKNGQVLRVVSFYRPCKSNGETTTYAQQKEYLQSNNSDKCPRQAFMEDLDAELSKWIDSGDHIVLGGDINAHLLDDEVVTLMDKHNLRSLLAERYPIEDIPAHFTCGTDPNQTGRSKVVDGLWGTPGVEVARCGIMEPGDFPSDTHCAHWADITFTSVLGHNPPYPQVPAARRLKLRDPVATEKYIKILTRLLDEHYLFQRQFLLEAQLTPNTPLTRAQAKEANEIDAIRTKCMLKAERKCRKKFFGSVDFSAAVDEPRKRIAFWRIAIRRQEGRFVRSRLWSRKKKAAKVNFRVGGLTIDDMKAHLKAAMTDYRAAKKNHADSRIKFMDHFDEEVRNRLLRIEQQRKLGRGSKWLSGQNKSKSVTHVVANGVEYSNKTGIENAVMPINEAKYRACEQTPFLQEPLLSDFGYTGHSENIDAVVNGTYTPPEGTDEYAKTLLSVMQRPDHVATSEFKISTYVSTEEHQRAWKRAKENTSSGKSGLHFGMFKANATVPRLAELDASLRSIAYSTGFVYERWKTGIDVQILKRIQDFRAEKLRTILQLEADFNMNNKKLNRDLSWKAERDGTFSRDNYGGRKFLRAVEVSMNQHLTYNSIWARRGRAIIMSNDAKGCFDRIAHIVATICMLKMGGPKAPLLGIINAIQEMKHYIRTAFGDSETYYGGFNEEQPPMQGYLQGNGMAGLSWLAVGSTIVEAMQRLGFGYKTWSLISNRAVELACYAFVDDTNLIHSNDDPNVSSADLIDEAQDALHSWEGLLKATGGALAPEKSFWSLVEVFCKNGTWGYRTQSDTPGNLQLYNNGNPETAARIEVTKAKEELGIQIRPDGKMIDEIKHLRRKAQNWADSVRTKKPPAHLVKYSLTHCIMKTIEYPLMATYMTKKDTDYIMAPILQAALPLCSVQKNLPRKLVYGTLRAQGWDIQDPYAVQLIEHLQALLRHCNRDTPSHDLHIDNMEAVQTHVGSSVPFWELPFEEYGFLAPDGWMKETWRALSETSLSLRGPLKLFLSLRQHDQHLMDIFIAQGYSEDLLLVLQNCRLYLRVTRLSEITSADGTRLEAAPFLGTFHPRLLQQHNKWPAAYKPSRNEWITWQNALKDCFLIPQARHNRLLQPLGPWSTQDDEQWIWWYSPSQNHLWEKTLDSWHVWQRNGQGTLLRPAYDSPQDADTDPPDDLCRASIHRRGATMISKSSHSLQVPPVPPIVDYSLSAELEKLPHDAHWAVRHIQFDDHGTYFATALQNGTAVAVSDGSYKFGFGTAAYVLEGPDSQHRILGQNQTPGPLKEGDSYRCELAGLYSVVLVADTIAKYHHLVSGSGILACDNISSLRVFEVDFCPDPSQECFDLIQAIWSILKSSPIRWQATHVDGHMDDKSKRPLTRLERLNVEMDTRAKAWWRHLYLTPAIPPSPIHHTIHREGWSIWNGNQKIIRPHRKVLYGAIQDPITTSYWVRHKRIPLESVPHIDWDSCETGFAKLQPEERQWVTKHASNECGVGTTLVKWKHQRDPRCPRCGRPEDTAHVLLCVAQGTTAIWNEQTQELTTYLVESTTEAHLQQAILTRLHQWRHQLPFTDVTDPDVQQALQAQDTLGWKNFIEGLPVKQWAHLQQRYYNSLDSSCSGKQWMASLIKHLNRLGRAMWKHRNDIKHFSDRHRHKEEEIELDHEIVRQFIQGPDDLPAGDRHHFRFNIITLQNRSLAFKQSWFANVMAARRRQARKRANDDTLQYASNKQQRLLNWGFTRRAT